VPNRMPTENLGRYSIRSRIIGSRPCTVKA
jgi:hypothetical protein